MPDDPRINLTRVELTPVSPVAEDTPTPAHVSQLKGQISADNSAAHSFQNSQNQTPRHSTPVKNAHPSELAKNLTGNLSSTTEKYFTCFRNARAFAKNNAATAETSEETLANAKYARSAAQNLPREDIKARDLADTSAFARMRKADIDSDDQKTFFQNAFNREGFDTPVTNANEESMLHDWRRFQSGELSEAALFGNAKSLSKDERTAFALNLARIVARDHSINADHILERDSVRMLEAKVNKISAQADHVEDGSIEQTRLAAAMEDVERAYKAECNILTNEGIQEGAKVLERLLAPPQNQDDIASNELPLSEYVAQITETIAPAARSYENAPELNAAKSLFERTCAAYNTQAESRIKEIYLQQHLMNSSALPILSMPLELRDSEDAHKAWTDARKDYLDSRGLNEFETEGDVAMKQLCHVLVVASFGLLLLSSTFKSFAAPYVNRLEFDQRAAKHADAKQMEYLQKQNRKMAEDWVKQQYNPLAPENSFPPDTLYDPQGLFAAFINPKAEQLVSDFQAREKLIEDVADQLYLAAKSDVMAAKERRSQDSNAPLSASPVAIPNEGYFTDAVFLRGIATSIVDGVASGLEWSARQHEQLEKPPSRAFINKRPSLGTKAI